MTNNESGEGYVSPAPTPEQQAADLAIGTAAGAIEKFNKAFSSLNRSLDALSFDNIRDPKEVADTGNQETEEEVALLQLQHAALAEQGLTISAFADGNDVIVLGGGNRPAKALGMVAYLDVADADRFAAYLAGMHHKKDRLGLRQFALVTMLADFRDQIYKNLIKVKWSFGDDEIKSIEVREPFLELTRKLSYAVNEADLTKNSAFGKSELEEFFSRADDGTLPEFILFERTVRRREKSLTSLDSVDIARRDFTDLKSAWKQAVVVFERLAGNPKAKDLTDECYEILGTYHAAAGGFMKKNFKTEWEFGMMDTLPKEGTEGHTNFSAYAAECVRELDTLGKRIEEIQSNRKG